MSTAYLTVTRLYLLIPQIVSAGRSRRERLISLRYSGKKFVAAVLNNNMKN